MNRKLQKFSNKVKGLHFSLRWLLGLSLILGGLLWFLPILGLWMIPLGLLVLAPDFKWARRGYLGVMVWLRRLRDRRKATQKNYHHKGSIMETKIPPPVYALMAVGLMWLLNQWLPLGRFDVASMHWLVYLLGFFGLCLDFTSLLLFIRAKTTINPLKPENSSALVVSGFYRFTRNPMYLGMAFLLSAWGVWLGSMGPFLVLPLFILLLTEMQIKPEEIKLKAHFGVPYTQYLHQVRRWL